MERKIGGRVQNSIYMPNVRLRGIAHFINHAARDAEDNHKNKRRRAEDNHKNKRRRKAGKSSAFYSLIHRIFLRQHRTIKAAAPRAGSGRAAAVLYENFVL